MDEMGNCIHSNNLRSCEIFHKLLNKRKLLSFHSRNLVLFLYCKKAKNLHFRNPDGVEELCEPVRPALWPSVEGSFLRNSGMNSVGLGGKSGHGIAKTLSADTA